ncbi:MAG: hypothetical protein P4L99_27935 [Chthoniobacter sp.]|nr:hypothetical protein [Chthoniobacter sp.]
MKRVAKSTSSTGGASAPVASGGNAAAPALPSPRPWKIVVAAGKRRTRVTDARGCTVLECDGKTTRFDLANLELIVAAVNDAAVAPVENIIECAAPAFTIHHGDRDETVDARAAIGGA